MSIANLSEEALTIGAAPDASTATLIRDAARQHLAGKDAEGVRWLCTHPDTPEDVLLEICNRGLCLDELGHRRGPRRLLEKLADDHHYPEAIISLALELYTSASEPEAAWVAFLDRHADHTWMLETLARTEGSSTEKEAAYTRVVDAHHEAARLLSIREACRAERRARLSDDPAEIKLLYQTRDPAIWRGLAGNPTTPNEILVELAEVKDVRFARETRSLAVENLAHRKLTRQG